MPLYKKDALYYLCKYLNPFYLIHLAWQWCKRLFFNAAQKTIYHDVLTKTRCYEEKMPYSTGFSYIENIKGDLMRFLPKHKDLSRWFKNTFVSLEVGTYNKANGLEAECSTDSIVCAVTFGVLLTEFRKTVSRYGTTASWIRPDLRTLKQHIEECHKELLTFHATTPDEHENLVKYLSDTIANDFPFC